MQTYAGVAKTAVAVLILCLTTTAEAQSSALAVGGSYNLTVTSSIEDYIIQNQRQYAANILAMDAQLAAYKLSYEKQLDTINVQLNLLEIRLQEVDRKLLPLELLNDLSKHCVQKYRGGIATIASVQYTVSNCAASANTAHASIVSAVTVTKTNLNNWYNNQFKASLTECERKHANSQLNYTICVTQAIASADSVTASYLKTFNTQMEQSTCAGESRVKQAVDCSFSTIYNTISKVGEVTRLIDNCTQGKEFCPPCPPPTVVTVDSCPEKINVTLSAADYRNATISNPFKGLNGTSTCVVVNFAQPA